MSSEYSSYYILAKMEKIICMVSKNNNKKRTKLLKTALYSMTCRPMSTSYFLKFWLLLLTFFLHIRTPWSKSAAFKHFSFCSLISKFIICTCIETSSDEIGSSHKINSGSSANALAIPILYL